MHPFYMLTSFSSVCTRPPPATRAESMLSSAISLTIIAHFKFCLFFKICWRSVVFPDPRKPDKIVTGNFFIGFPGVVAGFSD